MQRDNSFEHNQDGRVVRCKAVERNQLLLRPVDVETLVGEEHAVRAIWELVQKLDLKPFYAEIGALEGEAGRTVWGTQGGGRLGVCGYKGRGSYARGSGRVCEN